MADADPTQNRTRRGDPPAPPRSEGGRTAWARNLATPVRDFLGTETGSALVLVGAVLVALLWANVDFGSYSRTVVDRTSRSRSARMGSTTNCGSG